MALTAHRGKELCQYLNVLLLIKYDALKQALDIRRVNLVDQPCIMGDGIVLSFDIGKQDRPYFIGISRVFAGPIAIGFISQEFWRHAKVSNEISKQI